MQKGIIPSGSMKKRKLFVSIRILLCLDNALRKIPVPVRPTPEIKTIFNFKYFVFKIALLFFRCDLTPDDLNIFLYGKI